MKTLFRYPGNKEKRSEELALYFMDYYNFYEPFIGGGSVLLKVANSPSQFLPFNRKLYASDTNPDVIAYWQAVSDTDDSRYKELINELNDHKNIDIDFYFKVKNEYEPSAFRFVFLNKTSYNGFIHSSTGPIGGQKQHHKKYKVDWCWKIEKFINVIEAHRINLKGKLKVRCESVFDSEFWNIPNIGVYLDPPYYKEGTNLYGEYGIFDHQRLCDFLKLKNNWILSYDAAPEIEEMYKDFCTVERVSNYSGRKHKVEFSEYLIKPKS